jgi:tetratricopeptide (TPR) repeat protein
MRKALLTIVTGLILAVSGALGSVVRDDEPSPVARADAAAVATRGDLTAVMQGLVQHLNAQPRDARGWATLGHVYVEQSRVTADLAYYARADRALDRALSLDGADDLARAGQAALAAARHDFAGALRHADAALRLDPYQSTALAIRVDALTELGRYDDQLAALRTADRRAPGGPVLLRLSYAFELRGDLEEAALMLDRALAATDAPADRAFALTLRAEIDRKAGRPGAAGRRLRQALEANPDYGPAYLALARLATARGDDVAARRAWRAAYRRAGSVDAASELARVAEREGRVGRAAGLYRAVADNRASEIAAGVDMDLEIAQFEADHGSPRIALAAARREWGRRHSVHVADALGWALYRAGRVDDALPFALAATRLGTPDAHFWLHRAVIEDALGLEREARRHLAHGLRVDPGVATWLVQTARSHAPTAPRP